MFWRLGDVTWDYEHTFRHVYPAEDGRGSPWKVVPGQYLCQSRSIGEMQQQRMEIDDRSWSGLIGGLF